MGIKKGILLLFIVTCLVTISCSRYIGELGRDYILVNNGISGNNIVLVRQLIYNIDSLYVNSDKLKVNSFTLNIKSLHGEISYKSETNRLTEEMKAKINDDPTIEKLVFKDFTITGNNKLKDKKIEIIIADYDN